MVTPHLAITVVFVAFGANVKTLAGSVTQLTTQSRLDYISYSINSMTVATVLAMGSAAITIAVVPHILMPTLFGIIARNYTTRLAFDLCALMALSALVYCYFGPFGWQTKLKYKGGSPQL